MATNANTPRMILAAAIGTRYQIKPLNNWIFEIWEKGKSQYVCMLSYSKKRKKWSVGHNMVPSDQLSTDYQYDDPLTAIAAYRVKRTQY